MNKFADYLLNKFKTEAEGVSYYDNENTTSNFESEFYDFFDRLTIYRDDAIQLIKAFPCEIISAAMLEMGANNLDPMQYNEPEKFVNLAFSTIQEAYYTEFKKVFENH